MRVGFAAVTALALCRTVAAAEPKDEGVPTSVELTEATTLLYAWKNRDFAASDYATALNDDWGVWYNRLHAQVTHGSFRFNARLDNAWFFTSPDPTRAAIELTQKRGPSSIS